MPPSRRPKFYAVLCGRYGVEVYDSWDACHDAVNGFSDAIYKSFHSEEDAWTWISERGPYYLSPSGEGAMDRSMQASPRGDTVEPEGDVSMSAGTGVIHEQEEQQQQSHSPLSPPPTPPPCPPATLPPEKQEESIVLTDEQRHVIELCERGESVFFTGSAGTGKSVCLRAIIRHFEEVYSPEHIYVTASTGIAAVNVGGTTLHSYAGIQLGRESAEQLVEKIFKNKKKLARWNKTRVLIIDEISMIDGRLFDKLEYIAREVRRVPHPFGGIQLIICGDFFQLPPVPELVTSANGQKTPATFAFEARSWNDCIKHTIVLKQVFRQKQGDFVTMLNMMRVGELDPLGLAIFRKVDREVIYPDGIQPTELFPRRVQVEEANSARLRALQGEEIIYKATDYRFHDMYKNEISVERAQKLLDDTLAPRVLKLRIGAQVMLTKNIVDTKLVNGSLGTVIAFETTEEAKARHIRIAQTADDLKGGSRAQRARSSSNDAPFGVLNDPLLEAHRIQTNDMPVAASSTRAANAYPTPEEEMDEDDLSRDLEEVMSLDANGSGGNTSQKQPQQRLPTVRFTTGETMQFEPASFEVVNALGKREAMRQQVPLILAWALSIHKSQGQTLERVKVDLAGIFEKGQAYVAVSRATSLEGLQVLNFHESKVMAHPKVIHWSKTIAGMRHVYDEDSMEMFDPDEEEYWKE